MNKQFQNNKDDSCGYIDLDNPLGMCSCGKVLFALFNGSCEKDKPYDKRVGVTHATYEDEDHHNGYWSGMRVLVRDKDETEKL